ncbi:MAG: hypothetical protein JXA71_20525 [Chitinispirillaceae bacterium]|nr:hypothetical protein [Chitinispirillaceae bacterium]
MNYFRPGEHPSEEQLMELAVTGGPPDIREHADACAPCSDILKEFRRVKEQVDSVGVEDVPEQVRLSILNAARHGGGAGFLQELFLNPFFIALAVAIVVILLYFLVGSEVFRSP